MKRLIFTLTEYTKKLLLEECEYSRMSMAAIINRSIVSDISRRQQSRKDMNEIYPDGMSALDPK